MSRSATAKTCATCSTPYALTYQTVRARGRELDLPFCLPCWRRWQLARRLFLIALVVDLVLIAGGAVLYAISGRATPFIVALAFSIVITAAAAWVRRSARPRALGSGD